MKARIQFSIAIGLLLLTLGITWFIISGQTQEPTHVYPATINHDCAPWDGSAFTVSIPIEELVINISIYRSPDIMFPVIFSFPDKTMRDGNALLLLPVGLPAELMGNVSFPRVEQGRSIEGKFDLVTDTGQHFKGKFKAEWKDVIVHCG